LVFFGAAALAWGQTAAELEDLLHVKEIGWEEAAYFTLSSQAEAVLINEMAEARQVTARQAAFQFSLEQGWLPKNVKPDGKARLGGLSLLLMRSFNIPGGFMYRLFHNARYAYREMKVLGFFRGRSYAVNKVSGVEFLHILGDMLAYTGDADVLANAQAYNSEFKAALESLAAAKTRAEEARKRASDIGGSEYAAGDWEAAEAGYTGAGEQEKTDTLGDTKESAARYEQAAAAFDEAFKKALPKYAKALEDEILKERAAALEAGIAVLSPERLEAADDTVDKAVGLYEAQDYYAAADAGHSALDMFRLLKIGAETYTVWREIEDYGFRKYDPGDYDAATTAALAALDGYDALPGGGEDIKAVLRQAEEAQQGYNTVLETGWKAYSAERQAAAAAERQVALDLKANVAVKDEYNSAQGLYDRAGVSFRAERYPEAAELYFQSEFLFASAAGTAAEKRRIAEEAIQEAETKAAASDETARKAEAVLEGDTE
jgi:hypothetical protein